MESIYSKIDNKTLLHVVVREVDIVPGRQDVIAPDQFIQCSILNMEQGKTFKPHKHIWKSVPTREIIAQESWIVIRGSVKCLFFDTDDSIIATTILKPGDASFTLQGGHTYEILEDNTLVYEYKTGPYEGQSLDKTFIDDPRN